MCGCHIQGYCGPHCECSCHRGPWWLLAAKDATLGVGHIWTNVQCPAYSTLNPVDCICGRGA